MDLINATVYFNKQNYPLILLLILNVWLKWKILLDPGKWHIFWRFSPYWVQKYSFHRDRWKIRRWWVILQRHHSYLLILHKYFFQSCNSLVILCLFDSLHRIFRKVIYVPTNNLKLQSYSRNSFLTPPIFSKFQLLSQIWRWNSINFVLSFYSYNLQLITFPKRYLVSKSICWNWRYHRLKNKKRVKLNIKAIWVIFNRWYLKFQQMDFDARQRFGNVISCRF